VKYLQSIQHSQRIITLSDESSVSTKQSAAKSSQAKEKIRETREETADEKISRMNRIIKTNLQKMLNVTVIANIAVAVATISQAALSSAATATIDVKNRQKC
jgi:hypothetical protein